MRAYKLTKTKNAPKILLEFQERFLVTNDSMF